MASVFFLTKLKKGADEDKYEKWVNDYDYPTARNIKSIKSYTAFKVNAVSQKDSPYDFIEHIELTSIEEYKRDLETQEFQELLRQWSEFIDADSAKIIYVDPIGTGF